MLPDYSILRNKHQGETAFVLGSGTSLVGLDLAPIHQHVVIAVNASILLVDWQDGSPEKRYWISNDALCRVWDYWPLVKSAKAIKIVRNSWDKYFDEIPDFLQFHPRPTPEHIINPNDTGLAYCSSVPSAIDLALQMGCKKVYLLGVDQYQVGQCSHFWQMWDKPKPRPSRSIMSPFHRQKVIFALNDRAYPALKQFADTLGAEIYNCSPLSRVTAFPRIPFDEAIRDSIPSEKVQS